MHHPDFIDALGTGICVLNASDRTVRSTNPAFAKWFSEARPGALLAVLGAEAWTKLDAGRSVEVQVKVKRRTRMISLSLHVQGETSVLEAQDISRLRETEAMIDSYSTMADRRARALEREKTQVEKLLLNIMPRSVYEEYMTFGSVAPRLYEPVSVVMLDFVGFTRMAAAEDPNVTVSELNDIFTAFDRISELHGCERIKTVGDCYMAVTGLPEPNPEHALAAARCAAKMIRYLNRRNETHKHQWHARVGVASGSVVGSVVGVQKYIYDVFGPAVNFASRLQTLSQPGEITIAADLYDELLDEFKLERRRSETVRGFGEMEVASLIRRPEETSVV